MIIDKKKFDNLDFNEIKSLNKQTKSLGSCYVIVINNNQKKIII